MAVVRRPSQVTSRAAVLAAIKKCDELGREEFLSHNGYGPARGYFLRHDDRTYDSKAIVGVAFGFQHSTKPLRSDEFSGGARRVQPVLERLGFSVITTVTADTADTGRRYLSESLELGEVYTREQLREIFAITDATINNGVFQPANSKSIWLFVTKDKTADRPQLPDNLDGDVLEWTGQPAGLTDKKLIGHMANGDEVLLFYRQNRHQFEGGGFIYEGPFLYRSHAGSKPSAFLFDRDHSAAAQSYAKSEPFDPANTADGRDTILGYLRRRLGQGKFRRDLLKAYGGVCCVTGCSVRPLLEAAHIYPYRGKQTNHVTNGLLLRADIHSLFDLGLIAVRPDSTLDVCQSLSGTEYAKLKKLVPPLKASEAPSSKALEWHRLHIASAEVRNATLKVLE